MGVKGCVPYTICVVKFSFFYNHSLLINHSLIDKLIIFIPSKCIHTAQKFLYKSACFAIEVIRLQILYIRID